MTWLVAVLFILVGTNVGSILFARYAVHRMRYYRAMYESLSEEYRLCLLRHEREARI